MEYLNEENIAVTVLKAPLSEYNLETGVLNTNATLSHYEILYMSTFSMALSHSPHNRVFVNAEISQGQLCPGMRRFPNIGSLVTESIAAMVNLVRPVISLIVHLPGMMEIWGRGRPCSLNTHGHSILQKCGSELLSLDDFFESINRANMHYWASFHLIAQAIRGQGQDEVANIVDGVAYYGLATSSPVGAFSRVINSVKIPINDVGGMVIRTVFPSTQSLASAGFVVSSNPVKLAQFSYGLVAGCVVDIIPLAMRLERNPQDKEATRSLLSLLTNRLYRSKQAYYQSITQGVLQVSPFTNLWYFPLC